MEQVGGWCVSRVEEMLRHPAGPALVAFGTALKRREGLRSSSPGRNEQQTGVETIVLGDARLAVHGSMSRRMTPLRAKSFKSDLQYKVLQAA